MANITVFSGPMKCGKSTRLINEAFRQKHTGQNIKVFKPLIDNRYSENFVCDRNGDKIEALNIESINDIKKYDADMYFIDEFQFLSGDITAIQDLVAEGKKFYIAGLNLTSERKPFGRMGDIMCNADNVQMLTSICECCKKDNAVYSFYKGGKVQDIQIGDSEYIPVCSTCYNKLINNI